MASTPKPPIGTILMHLAPLNPEPLGDMTLAPLIMTGRTEAELARSMAEHLRAARPGSGAEALRALRNAFPNSPLTLRVTALAALMRR